MYRSTYRNLPPPYLYLPCHVVTWGPCKHVALLNQRFHHVYFDH